VESRFLRAALSATAGIVVRVLFVSVCALALTGALPRVASKSIVHPARATPRPTSSLPIQVATRDYATVVRQAISLHPLAPNATFGIWDEVLLGRYLAVDGLIAKYADHYGNDVLWQVLAYCSESTLDPLAQGGYADDRGLGQVGYPSEATTRAWGADPSSPYYTADLSPSGSIWDPQTNIILSAIALRSVYAEPQIDSNEQAYGTYTVGDAALSSTGSLSPLAAARVQRASSFEPEIGEFIALKALANPQPQSGSETIVAAAAITRAAGFAQIMDPVVREILLIDAEFGDGKSVYLALRDLYLRLAAEPTALGWGTVTFLGDALRFTELAERVYGTPGDAAYARISQEVYAAGVVGSSSDAALRQAYAQLLLSLRAHLPPG
jgi:hypothetical protein